MAKSEIQITRSPGNAGIRLGAVQFLPQRSRRESPQDVFRYWGLVE